MASYYARSFEGRTTASGVPYDGRAMTCAHPTFPFGTLLRVTDLESGKSVLVKVTDRGPFARGRIVDLSWAAARELGMLTRGLARVAVELAGR
jgi:rare lipoprotein A